MATSPLTRTAACLAFLIVWPLSLYLKSQNSGTRTDVQAPTLEAFFNGVLQNPSSLPEFEKLHRLTVNIGNIRSQEIVQGLPSVFAALEYQDERVKAYACAALFAIAQRPDGAKLLRSHIDEIGRDLLDSPYESIRAGEVTVLTSLKPVPPPEVVPILLTLLKRHDASTQAQGSGIIFELLHIAPENQEVIAAIQEFTSRPLNTKSRIDVLNALGNPSVKDAQLIESVATCLDDPDAGVRLTAIQALTRIGIRALRLAEADLIRLTVDPKQPTDVQSSAKQALQQLRSSKIR